MARARFQAPKGTQDVLPPASARWEALLATYAPPWSEPATGCCRARCSRRSAFQRESEGADAVRKEMYDFLDKGDSPRLRLPPGGTAPVVQAFVQHQPASPWKVWYATPAFR
ncbi:MAG: hypothetical protein R2701_13510 [Acidimicrobiales bacterium]